MSTSKDDLFEYTSAIDKNQLMECICIAHMIYRIYSWYTVIQKIVQGISKINQINLRNRAQS